MIPDVLSSLVLPAARDASAPCLTYLDPASGERTELSGRAVALWVAKTANLVVDELGLAPGGVIALRLPAHWQAWTWLLGGWLAGCVMDVGDPAEPVPDDADAVVTSTATLGEAGGTAGAGGVPLVGLALRPMALPGPPPPDGVLDFDVEVRGHGDRWTGSTGPDGVGQARAGARQRPWTELAAPAERPGGRLLTRLAPRDLESVAAVSGALAAGSGVVVLARGGPAPDLGGEAVTHATPESRDLLT